MKRSRIQIAAEVAFVAALLLNLARNTALLALWALITAAALLFLAYRLTVYIISTRKAQS